MRNWADDGHAPAFSEQAAAGKHRYFQSRDILAATVMKAIMEHGVPPRDAAALAKGALTKLDEYCKATGSDDLAEDIKAAGLDKAVLYYWREGSGWKSRLDEHDYGWTETFAKVGIGQSDLPRSYAAANVFAIAREVAERIRAFEAERAPKKQRGGRA